MGDGADFWQAQDLQQQMQEVSGAIDRAEQGVATKNDFDVIRIGCGLTHQRQAQADEQRALFGEV